MKIFKSIFSLLPKNLKINFWTLLTGMLFLALVETGTVGIIAFYAAAISDPKSAYEAILKYQMSGLKIADFLPVYSPKSMIGFFSILVIISVIFKNLYNGFITFKISEFSAKTEAYFGQRLLDIFLNKDYLWIIKQNSADLIQKVNWRHNLGRGFITPNMKIISEIFLLLMLLIALLVVQPIISLLFIIVQGSAGYIVYHFLRKGLDKSAKKCKDFEMELNRQITRSLHGIKDVKITNTSDYFVNYFTHYAGRYAKFFGKQQFWRDAPLLSLETLGFTMIACSILFMLFVLGYSPLETTGTTALLAVTAWRTLPAFNRVVSSFAGIRTTKPYVRSLMEILIDTKSLKKAENITYKPLKFDKQIEFKHLNFHYDEALTVLDDFNLIIKKGESVGIMGPSGCGKSTFVDLLAGLLFPVKGRILIDNIELNENNAMSWQINIGYVPQFPYIFDGTLVENVAFGVAKEDVNEDRILEVCKMAAIDFLDQLPNGIHSDIGERGIKLSGGQRQRVAIARALYRNPELIIFDEATSALDEENDKQIRKLIAGLKGKLTLVIISHRKSTVDGCDKILKIG